MRPSILFLIGVIVITLVIVLPLKAPDVGLETTPELTVETKFTAEPQSTRTPAPTVTWPPVTPPPHALSEYELIAIAADYARINGLTTFDGSPLIKWQTVTEHEAGKGVRSIRAQDTVVFTVAFRGTGVYRGFGGGYSDGPLAMDGFTVTLNALNGDIMATSSGFESRLDAVPYTDATATPFLLSDKVLLERAEEMAQAHRFELTIDAPVTMWMTQGEWLAEQGITTGVWDSEPLLFVAAFRGTGTWWTEDNTSYQADGITIALSVSGLVEGTIGSYRPPPYTSGNAYYEVRNEATLAAVQRILAATPEPE